MFPKGAREVIAEEYGVELSGDDAMNSVSSFVQKGDHIPKCRGGIHENERNATHS